MTAVYVAEKLLFVVGHLHSIVGHSIMTVPVNLTRSLNQCLFELFMHPKVILLQLISVLLRELLDLIA